MSVNFCSLSGLVWQHFLRKLKSRPSSSWAIAFLFFLKVCTASSFLRSLIWEHSNRCSFATLDCGTRGHVYVFIVPHGSMRRNMKYRKHVWGVLWGPLCFIFSDLWFHICRSMDNARLAEPWIFLCSFHCLKQRRRAFRNRHGYALAASGLLWPLYDDLRTAGYMEISDSFYVHV